MGLWRRPLGGYDRGKMAHHLSGAGCHTPATRPAAASWPHYLPARPCAAWKPVHGSPRQAGHNLRRGHWGIRGAWTRRKPLLLLWFDGVFLLRFAQRRFRGLLLQEPPRTTAQTSTVPGPLTSAGMPPRAVPAPTGRRSRRDER